MQPKSRRLVTEQNLENYTETELEPVRATAQNANTWSSQALSLAQSADQKSDNAVDRVEQIETMAGLSPGEVTDAQTANLLQQPESSTRAALSDAMATEVSTPGSTARQAFNTATAEVVYDVPGPTGTHTGDVAMVLAAAQQAVAEGRDVITMAPGHYDLEDMEPDHIHNCYLVGDNVTFTNRSWVYPFGSGETFRDMQPKSKGGRGRIAIELDDAELNHWYEVFPLTKELGITMGTAWHTANGRRWIKEAHRHGWEVISHLPENITAVEYLNSGLLEQVAQESLDAVADIVGTSENVGFVYPQHGRNSETDRILSKYYSRGRGHTEAIVYQKGEYHPWLVSAASLDAHTNTGGLTDGLRRILENVADTDGQLVFYAHSNVSMYELRNQGIREVVQYARHLGIDIVNPGQIWAEKEVSHDRYFEMEEPRWHTTGSANFDNNVSYHGSRSVRFDLSNGNGAITANYNDSLPRREGAFTVLKISFRYRADQDLTTHPQQGFIIESRYSYKNPEGDPVFTHGSHGRHSAEILPEKGSTTIPAAEWEKVETFIYVEPSAVRMKARLSLWNPTSGGSLWIDELKIEHVGFIPEVKYTLPLEGTAFQTLWTAIPRVAEQNIKLIPRSPAQGEVYILNSTRGRLDIVSTSTEDDVDVDVYVSPRATFGA